jgi:hypothetical protein
VPANSIDQLECRRFSGSAATQQDEYLAAADLEIEVAEDFMARRQPVRDIPKLDSWLWAVGHFVSKFC